MQKLGQAPGCLGSAQVSCGPRWKGELCYRAGCPVLGVSARLRRGSWGPTGLEVERVHGMHGLDLVGPSETGAGVLVAAQTSAPSPRDIPWWPAEADGCV